MLTDKHFGLGILLFYVGQTLHGVQLNRVAIANELVAQLALGVDLPLH